MTQFDELAQEHIDYLQSCLDAADIENEELKQEIIDLKTAVQMMITDRTYCP